MTSDFGWTVTLTKDRATWYHSTGNPQGGSVGSNCCGPQYIALARALRSIPVGAQYRLTVNGQDHGLQVRMR